MRHRLARLLSRLYPPAWRERYGEEFAALLEDSRPGWRGLADIAWNGLAMQWRMGPGPVFTALALALAGLLAALVFAHSIPNRFVSVGVVKIPVRLASGEAVQRATRAVLQPETVSRLMEAHRLYREGGENGEELRDLFLQSVRISGLMSLRAGGEAFRVGFSHDDPVKARAVTRELIGLVMEQYRRDNSSAPPMEVMDAASFPRVPMYPNRGAIAMMGLALGLLVGLILHLSRRYTTAFLLALAGLAAGVAVARFIPDRYLSVGVIQAPAGLADPEAVDRAYRAALTPAVIAGLIKKHEIDAPSSENPQGRFEKAASVSKFGPGGIFRVAFQHEDRVKAKAVTEEVMSLLMAEFTRQNPGSALDVWDQPGMPSSPVFPNRPVIAGLCALSGLLLAGLLALGRRWSTHRG